MVRMRRLGSKNVGTVERRRVIADAALRVFLSKGIVLSTIDDILEAAQVSKGSLYHHFESKEGLAAAINIDALQKLHESLLSSLDGEESAERGVKGFVHGYVEWFRTHRDLGKFIFLVQGSEELSAFAKDFSALHHKFLERCFAWVHAQQRRGALRDIPRDIYVPIIIGPSRDYIRTNLRDGKKVTKEAGAWLADAAWEMTKGAVKQAPAAPLRKRREPLH